MDHSKCIAALFYKLYSLRTGLGTTCPNKRSYNEGLARQIADAVGQTLKLYQPILASFKQKKVKWKVKSDRNSIRNAEFIQQWRDPGSILSERDQRVGSVPPPQRAHQYKGEMINST